MIDNTFNQQQFPVRDAGNTFNAQRPITTGPPVGPSFQEQIQGLIGMPGLLSHRTMGRMDTPPSQLPENMAAQPNIQDMLGLYLSARSQNIDPFTGIDTSIGTGE